MLINSLLIVQVIASICVITSFLLVLFKPLLKLTDFFVHITVFSLALWLTLFNISISDNVEGRKFIVGKVLTEPEIKNNSVLIQVKQLNMGKPVLFKPRIYLYSEKDSGIVQSILPGTIIGFEASLKRIENRGNPDEFNYERYLLSNRVLFQAYLAKDKIEVIEKQGINFSLPYSVNRIHQLVLDEIHSSIKSKEARQLIAALLIGDRRELDDNILQSYTNAGIVHVLAISGLHVGIIYMLLMTLLRVCERRKGLNIFRMIIIILVIWSYALLTGFSPSVNRAATMFSLFAVAKVFDRDVSIFNLIAASAMLIMIVNPLIIYQIGFQLSYAAVCGIVFFQPVFNQWFVFTHKIPDYLYKLFTVSLSAQLATFPISIYYFNQFPTYFWLSNLFVIPIVFLFVIVSILFVLFFKISFINLICSAVLGLLAKALNTWVEIINSLPHSLICNLKLSLSEVTIVVFCVWIFMSWYRSGKTYFAVLTLMSLCSFLILNIFSNIKKGSTHQIIVYNTFDEIEIGVYSGNKNLFISTSENFYSGNDYKNYYKKHWLRMGINGGLDLVELDLGSGIKDTLSDHMEKQYPIIRINENRSYFVVDSKSLSFLKKTNVSRITAIVGENIFPPDTVLSMEMIIIPSCIYTYYSQQWISYANKGNIPYFDMAQKGAFISEF